MTDYPQRVSDSFNERMRLIRVRRKKERLRFWEEFQIIPRWLVYTVLVLFVLAEVIAYLVNTNTALNGGQMFPPELKDNPVLASLALGGIVALVSLFFATMIFMIAYVNRDAARRGMNSALWTLLVLILTPEAYLPLRNVGAQFHASMEGATAAQQVFDILDNPLPHPAGNLAQG